MLAQAAGLLGKPAGTRVREPVVATKPPVDDLQMFEFITIGRPVALRCLNRLTALGFGGFDLALGDTKTLTLGGWVDATEMATHLLTLPHETNSGDVYCVPGDQP